MNASQFPTIAPNPNRIHLCMQTVQSTQFTAKHLYNEFLVVKWAYCAPQNKYFNCLMTKEHTVIRLHICTFNLMGFELGYYLDLCNLYRNFWNFSEQNTMQSNILGIWLFIISDMCFLEQQNVFFYSNFNLLYKWQYQKADNFLVGMVGTCNLKDLKNILLPKIAIKIVFSSKTAIKKNLFLYKKCKRMKIFVFFIICKIYIISSEHLRWATAKRFQRLRISLSIQTKCQSVWLGAKCTLHTYHTYKWYSEFAFLVTCIAISAKCICD